MAIMENGHHSPRSSVRDVYIVGAARTPLGSFMGCLSSVSATELGTVAIKESLRRSGVPSSAVDEVVMGNVLQANLGQNPARQAALRAGLPDSVVCSSVNKICASGMKAIISGAQSIMVGTSEIVVAGGMESMSNAPYYLGKARSGYRLGNGELVDGMQRDGLVDAYQQVSMGVFADECAKEHSFTREAQDEYAVATCQRAIEAAKEGAFDWEIAPVEVKGSKGKPSTLITEDEQYSKFDPVKLRNLRPCFTPEGTVTAGNASSINDGAAALVLASRSAVEAHGLKVLAVIKGFGEAELTPSKFTTAPALAVPKALRHADVTLEEVSAWEVNEAFSVVALANTKLLGVNPAFVNIHGGSVALGHPLGCSGARIVVTLLGVLKRKGGKIGAAGVCNGGGGASAIVIEACDGLQSS